MASKRSKTDIINSYNSGVVFYNKKDYSHAIAQFEEALDGEPNNMQYKMALANSYNNRGVMLYETKNYKKAMEDFQSALKIEPDNKQYRENHSLAEDSQKKNELDMLCEEAYKAYNEKKYPEAISKLKEAIKLEPNDKNLSNALAVAYNGRGVKYYEEKKFALAIEDFEMAKKLQPNERQYELNSQWTKEAAKREK